MICSFQNNMSIFLPLVSVRLVFMCPLGPFRPPVLETASSGPLVGEETRDLEEIERNVDDKVV